VEVETIILVGVAVKKSKFDNLLTGFRMYSMNRLLPSHKKSRLIPLILLLVISFLGFPAYAEWVSVTPPELGHQVQYLFDWGDGTDSGWLPVGQTSSSHQWIFSGNYYVSVKARCATNTDRLSAWSNALSVGVTP